MESTTSAKSSKHIGTVKQTTSLPVNAIEVVVTGTKSIQADPGRLQTGVLRFADSFAVRISTELDEYAALVNTPERRTKALKWKLSLASSALGGGGGGGFTGGGFGGFRGGGFRR